MLQTLKKLWTFKTAVLFFLLAVILVPIAMYMPSAFDKFALVTCLGLDLDDEGKIELNALIITPEVSGQFSENLRKFDSNGESITDCMNRLDTTLGKKVDLAHCEAIILGEKILESDVTKYLDYFIRNANLSLNAVLVSTPDDAGDLLDAISSAQTNDDISLQTLIAYNNEILFTSDINIENYYKSYNSENSTYFLPILKIKEKSSAGAKSKSGGSSSGGQSAGGSGGDEEKSIEATGETLIIKNGKKVRPMTDDEIIAMNLFSKNTKRCNIAFYGVEEDKIIVEGEEKRVSFKTSFDQDMPVMKISLNLLVLPKEYIKSKYNLSDFVETEPLINKDNEELFFSKIRYYLDTLIDGAKEGNLDILNVYDYFDAYNTKNWENFYSKHQDDYMSKVKFDLKISYRDTL